MGLAGFSANARAAPLRLIASDAKGVTIQVTVGAWTLSAPGPDGRVRVNALPGGYVLGEPGRPQLPAFATTLAIPPDARPSARVIASECETVNRVDEALTLKGMRLIWKENR